MTDYVEAAYDHEHNQTDLSAQQDTSSWTFGLLLLGVAGFVTSLLGLVLLWENLRLVRADLAQQRADAEDQKEATQAQINAVSITANAADEANRLNQRRFEAERRPWLRLEVEAGGDFRWRTPDGGAQTKIKFVVQNVGAGPATDIESFIDRLIHPPIINLNEIEKRINAMVPARQSKTALPRIAFAGSEPQEITKSLGFSREEFDEVLENWRVKNLEVADFPFQILIFGCVTYRSPLLDPALPPFKIGFLASYGEGGGESLWDGPTPRHVKRGGGDIAIANLGLSIFRYWAD